MLEIGTMAPGFTLTADDGRAVSLSDFLGRKVVLYFYPKADTPGCTKQACALRDAYGDIDAGDAVVIGVSPDAPAELVKFREKYELPFVLLSDPDHRVAEAYGAWGEKKMYGKAYAGILRSHFGVDEEGRLAEVSVNVKPLTTADLALRMVSL
ncbi:MAG: thioredoxin-dependent thiol peroxidase [Anaerolineae bacterium]|nr:thioredoxin-dependent thiol peroxidase [Anaerolineae bacterium]